MCWEGGRRKEVGEHEIGQTAHLSDAGGRHEVSDRSKVIH